ncbi:hypothetical protein KGM_204492 [Danaus plexippus plexippus]|uniref:Uncharacterized protein n=1 Tax=Danaus plexippus plexippus TaxID=278856 RepID=A0A212FFN3_DANPL|nr:hypothetical protein KGM_204492 [Danaus plexippus plexippus]
MFLSLLLIISCQRLGSVFADKDSGSESDFGTGLISSLRNDANLDLSVDEEYEDLRAEALAYHSALASLTSRNKDSGSESDFGTGLISSLRNDANLDLSVDEEYEDLRAEALAYHSALASLTSRRSLITTECWKHGGICISFKLCPGYRQLTEIPGCKNRHRVCCFVWNQFEVRDMRDKGIGNPAFPWSLNHEYGGEGIREITTKRPKKKKRTTVKEIKKNSYKRL